MALIEFKQNSAFQISKFEIEGKTFIGISRMYKKKGDSEWHMGKNVAIPYENKDLLKKIIKELESYAK